MSEQCRPFLVFLSPWWSFRLLCLLSSAANEINWVWHCHLIGPVSLFQHSCTTEISLYWQNGPLLESCFIFSQAILSELCLMTLSLLWAFHEHWISSDWFITLYDDPIGKTVLLRDKAPVVEVPKKMCYFLSHCKTSQPAFPAGVDCHWKDGWSSLVSSIISVSALQRSSVDMPV